MTSAAMNMNVDESRRKNQIGKIKSASASWHLDRTARLYSDDSAGVHDYDRGVDPLFRSYKMAGGDDRCHGSNGLLRVAWRLQASHERSLWLPLGVPLV